MTTARQSETIGELAKALAAAQAEIKPPKKDKVGKIKGQTKDGRSYEYEYHYSDLSALFDAVRGPFGKHGLSFSQPTRLEGNHLILETVLMHESGEWRMAEYPIPLGLKPQEMGSELTYGKRYSAAGVFGIAAEEDDDGTVAQHSEASRSRSAPAKRSEPASDTDAQIRDVVSSIVMTYGGNEDEIVGRASAFPKDKEAKDQAKQMDEIRWTAPRDIVLAPHNMYIRGIDKLGSSEKWKKGTLARLLSRREALRAEPSAGDAQAEMEGRDAEAEAFQAGDDDVPF